MRISDWSSDVCSSDLKHPQSELRNDRRIEHHYPYATGHGDEITGTGRNSTRDREDRLRSSGCLGSSRSRKSVVGDQELGQIRRDSGCSAGSFEKRNQGTGKEPEKSSIGRASCRERVCKYV